LKKEIIVNKLLNLKALFLALSCAFTLMVSGQNNPPDTLPFPITNNIDPTQTTPQSFDLGDPSSVSPTIVYDPTTGTYIFKETIGKSDLNYRNPSMMTLEEYLEYERRKAMQENWKEKIDAETQAKRGFQPSIKIPGKVFTNIFGSNEISIRPQGSIELSFGVNSSRYDNPILPVKQRRITRFDFQQQIQLNLVGQIGTKIKLNASYNTQAAFDFDNITKLGYTGDEDQIMQKLEVGNVTLPLKTSLIQGSQVLFGVYSQMKFGRFTIDGIMASSKSKRQEINIAGKAQVQPFEISADNYEANRHYFINLNFRDEYDEAMSTLPIPKSEINITRMEVWLTNRVNNTENTRNIVAFTDLGESKTQNLEGTPGSVTNAKFPDNEANGLYEWAAAQAGIRGFSNAVSSLSAQGVAPGPFVQAKHYEKVENARKLTDQEYSYNALLGFISLNLPLNNDEVLAVAYEYTYKGETYQVGEFSVDGISGQDALILKLLKPTLTNPKNRIWDLMMKNVYSIGAYQLDKTGFRLDVLYNNPENSLLVPFFPAEGIKDKQLVTVLEMDRINMNEQPFSDGLFDFAPMTFTGNRSERGGTVNPRNGRVYFSTVEPFGQLLRQKLLDANIPEAIVNNTAYTELYDSTKTAAQQIPLKNRFVLKGQYQSSVTSDIPLNSLNVPQGAVTITAGGIKLVEGQDFTVDYNLGRVKILNSGILESNTPLKISIESNSVFGFQAKSLIGTHMNYRFSEDFNIGGTWMRMMERPVTQKVDIGSEPFKNNVLGLDVAFRKDLPFLTKLVDLLPVISTKAKSSISFTGEVAHLIPGVPKAITKEGMSYIDDFEGSQTTIDLKSVSAWKMASIPQGQPSLFPEASAKNLSAGYRRAKVAWYQIDQLFYSDNALRPKHISDNPSMLSDSRMRLVKQTDIFTNSQLAYGTVPIVQFLDLGYYPTERGMYNYDTTATTIDANGNFTNPENRWGGIMRALTTNDFEQTNIEFIQFWILDPFNQDAESVNPNTQHNGGDLYFNLGNISEDVLPDSRKSFENGLPPTAGDTANIDATPWANVSTQQVVVNAFNTDPESRANQDVGLDGRNDVNEKLAYNNYVSWVQANSNLTAAAKAKMIADPSSDNYKFYRDDVYDNEAADILERYKSYNSTEGNSYTTEMSDTANVDGYPTQATNLPDLEDLNLDNNISETESYFQYKVSLRPGDTIVGQNFVTSVQTFIPEGSTKRERWIQYKIPVTEPEKVINGITDFRSIRFMRMFLKEFDEEVVIRFAKLEFIRGEWRRFREDLVTPGEGIVTDPNLTTFNIAAVNFEENAERNPINYKLPPSIIREVDPSQVQQRQLNEQSLTLEVCNLKDGDARAAYRNVQFDVRTYKKLKLFVHAEEITTTKPLNNEDLTLFIRLGTDFTENYYEYEMPLTESQWYDNNDLSIWPEANNVEIIFDDLLDAKKKRNAITGTANSTLTNNVEWMMIDPRNPKRLIKVKGSPNLQGIRSIMIGVRNPSKQAENPWSDDGEAKCAMIWVNELRLTDFQNEGGSAAVARMQIQAADFATVSMSGNYSGVNWGSIESRVQERQRNQQVGFDFNTNVQLGQFLGKRVKLALPFFYGYSVGVINPEYDPFNPDIRLADYDPATRKERARAGQDYTERKSYNFTNVRKELGANAKPHLWNISNFALSYAYSENLHRDFNLEYDRTKIWRGGITYNYSFTAKPIEPFKKIKFMQKSKWWSIIRDANFFLTPKNIGMNNDLIRSYNERQVKNNITPGYEFAPVFVKSFTWNRSYNFGYDITKNLKFNFNANNRSLFDENQGRIDKKLDPENYRDFKDTIRAQMKTLGQSIDYTHDYGLQYNIPFDKIPVLDWVTGNAKYSGTFNWQRAPLGQSEYGNIIQNSRVFNTTAQLNFTTLYSKSKFLQKIISDGKPQRAKANGMKNPDDGAAKTDPKPGVEKEEVLEELVPDKPEEEMTPKELRKWERKKRQFERKKRRLKRKKEKEEKQKDKVNPVSGFLGRLLMTVRSVSGTYALTDGTLLPGYNQGSSILGFTNGNERQMAGFVFGQQRYNLNGKENGYDIARVAAENNWLVQNSALNRQYTNTHTQNISGRASLEPLKDLSIELTANRNYGLNSGEFFRWNDENLAYESQSRMETATLTYSTISIGSAFTKLGKNFESSLFDNMRANRTEISKLLADKNTNSVGVVNGYATGYGGTQQEVVIGAFLTSYTDKKVNESNINPVKNMPLPNWNINYNGLTKFPFMKKIVKNFVVRHGYSSSVTVGGLQTNLKATQDVNGNATSLDQNDNFYVARNVSNITVSERFSPLIGVDATWNVNGQGLLTKFELKKDRSANLALTNNQITEILGTEWVIGVGYKFPKVKLPIKFKSKNLEEPLNIRFDFSFRDNLTVIRKIEENTNQGTAGQRVISIKSSADYNIGQNLTIQLYYDQVINTPKIASSYPTGNTSAGIRFRLNLAGL
jgi:cell surface protein SprA